MNKMLNLFIFFILMISSTLVESTQVQKITEFKTSNAKWNTPDDGSNPQLLKYDIQLTLDDGHLYNMTGVTDPQVKNEYRVGDEIQVTREGFFLNDTSKSWFELENVKKGNKRVLYGKSRLQPVDSTEGVHPLLFFIRVIPGDYYKNQVFLTEALVNKDKPILGDTLQFKLKNYYFSLPIKDKLFHGFYALMPIEILHEEVSPPDSFGQQVCQMQILNPLTNETFNIISEPFSEATQATVKQVVEELEYTGHYPPELESYKKYAGRYKIITLNDNQTLITKYKSHQSSDTIQEGDPIEIVKEDKYHNKSSNTAWNMSKYVVKNLRTNETVNFEGTSRKPEPYYHGSDIGHITNIEEKWVNKGNFTHTITYNVKTTRGTFRFSYEAQYDDDEDPNPSSISPKENKQFGEKIYYGKAIRFLEGDRVLDLVENQTISAGENSR